MTKKNVLLILLVIVILSVGFRMLGINRPLIGNFSSRQIVYAMYARNFIEGGYNLLKPTTDMLKNGKQSIDYGEYPWVSFAVGLLHKLSGADIDMLGRLFSIIFYAFALILLFMLVKSHFGYNIALLASLFFAIAPSSIVYGQSFLMDMPGVCLTIAAIYFAILWQNSKNYYIVLSAAMLALATLIRIQIFFILTPVLYILITKSTLRVLIRSAYFYVFLLISLGVPALWYIYGYIESSVSDNSMGVLNVTWQVYGRGFPDPLFFKPEFYKKAFDIFSGIMVGPFIFVLFILGLFLSRIWSTSRYIIYWMLVTIIVFLLAPLKLVDLNYYSLHLAAPACIIAAVMADTIWQKIKSVPNFNNRISLVIILIVLLGASLRYSLSPAFGSTAEDKMMVNAGKIADKILPKDAFILSAYGTNPALLYYSHRKGWPFYITAKNYNISSVNAKSRMLYEGSLMLDPTDILVKRIRESADYLVVANKAELDSNQPFKQHVMSNYKIIFEDKNTIIFELKNSKGIKIS